MEKKYDDIMQKLIEYNQNDFIDVIKNLNEKEKEEILKQVSQVNLEEVQDLYKKLGVSEEKKFSKIEPINAIDKEKLSEEELRKYEDIGIKIIKENKFAVVTMAGGQRNKAWI